MNLVCGSLRLGVFDLSDALFGQIVPFSVLEGDAFCSLMVYFALWP